MPMQETVLQKPTARVTLSTQEGEALLAQIRAYNPDPARLCARFGVEARAISPYLIDTDTLPEADRRKAHPTDESPLRDYWVFRDFWKRLGIPLPAGRARPDARVRLSRFYPKRLPQD